MVQPSPTLGRCALGGGAISCFLQPLLALLPPLPPPSQPPSPPPPSAAWLTYSSCTLMLSSPANAGPWPTTFIEQEETGSMFPPLLRWRPPALLRPLGQPAEAGSKRKRRSVRAEAPLVENEPGLCDRMEEAHVALRRRLLAEAGGKPAAQYRTAAATASASESSPGRAAGLIAGEPEPFSLAQPQLPPLAELTERQQRSSRRRRFRVVRLSSGGARGGGRAHSLAPPLLFHSLVRNEADSPARLEALGCEWLLPARSSFSLCRLAYWPRLSRILPRFRCLVVDPPWPSRSVQRAGAYKVLALEELAEALRSLPALCDRRGCLICVWMTNAIKVQEMVEQTLLPAWGATKVGLWYWLKLSPDGGPAVGAFRSPHRKPWEPLLLATLGGAAPPLPPRLVFGSLPEAKHSAKPALDGLLRRAAPHLLAVAAGGGGEGGSAGGEGGAGGGGGSSEEEDAAAWRSIAKAELFARRLRSGWHSLGDEVIAGSLLPSPTPAARLLSPCSPHRHSRI